MLVDLVELIGRSDFDKLHARARRRGFRPGFDPVVFCAFDALVVDGLDVMPAPLSVRKAQLRRVLSARPPSVLMVDGIEGEGEALFQQALALKLEGIVAKRLDSPYQPGIRSRDWLKIKRPGAVPAERFKERRR